MPMITIKNLVEQILQYIESNPGETMNEGFENIYAKVNEMMIHMDFIRQNVCTRMLDNITLIDKSRLDQWQSQIINNARKYGQRFLNCSTNIIDSLDYLMPNNLTILLTPRVNDDIFHSILKYLQPRAAKLYIYGKQSEYSSLVDNDMLLQVSFIDELHKVGNILDSIDLTIFFPEIYDECGSMLLSKPTAQVYSLTENYENDIFIICESFRFYKLVMGEDLKGHIAKRRDSSELLSKFEIRSARDNSIVVCETDNFPSFSSYYSLSEMQ
ncbi:MAG: hypothetical protein MHMPM18_000199 [Marteilia pararefringens]